MLIALIEVAFSRHHWSASKTRGVTRGRTSDAADALEGGDGLSCLAQVGSYVNKRLLFLVSLRIRPLSHPSLHPNVRHQQSCRLHRQPKADHLASFHCCPKPVERQVSNRKNMVGHKFSEIP